MLKKKHEDAKAAKAETAELMPAESNVNRGLHLNDAAATKVRQYHIVAERCGNMSVWCAALAGAEIIKKYEHWITDERKMALAKPDAIYMHPLPADRNIEVTDVVMDGPQSVVYDEAENRLHAQKGILAWVFGANPQ
jgi:ornithine carbamoyltransferase